MMKQFAWHVATGLLMLGGAIQAERPRSLRLQHPLILLDADQHHREKPHARHLPLAHTNESPSLMKSRQ
jgi:hypothetical protein